MSSTKPRSTSRENISLRRTAPLAFARIRINVPSIICRVYAHPLLRLVGLDFVIHDSSELPLEDIQLISLESIETKQVGIALFHHAIAKFDQASVRRGCSREALINSALAEWLSHWYRNGQPIPFLEICKDIGIDCLMTSDDSEILTCYYAGVFGPPAQAGDTSFWSDAPFAWAVKMRQKYARY